MYSSYRSNPRSLVKHKNCEFPPNDCKKVQATFTSQMKCLSELKIGYLSNYHNTTYISEVTVTELRNLN